MAGFLARQRLFAVRLTARTGAPYLFDLIGLALLASAWLGVDALRGLAHGAPVATVSPWAVAMVAALGIYGIRLAMWLAILRRNRMPQTGEWLLCLIPGALAVLALPLSGLLVQGYAAARGYHRCADSYYNHSRAYVFAAPGHPCPP